MSPKASTPPASAPSPDADADADAAAESMPELSYEDARDELLDVVARLEAGTTTLEASLTLWERAEELAKICQQWLAGARARLESTTGAAADASPDE